LTSSCAPTFTARDAVADISGERADRSQASTTTDLAKLNTKIANAQAMIAAPGIDADTRQEASDELAALQMQCTRLAKRQHQAGGLPRFLALVDAEQVVAQVATLTTVQQGLAAHRATLSS
jgi:hypothetical protein